MKHLLLVLFVLTTAGLRAQTAPNVDNAGLALSGYDPVSYFSGTPVKGTPSLKSTYKGATYRFATAQNREAFLKNPERFEPAYGGWCAYAIGKKDELVEVNPLTFKIVDGRLLLFYNAWLTNTLELWNADETNLAPAASRNWARRNPTPAKSGK